MKFEVLSLEHTNALLEFELSNRAWFESMIAPRAETFYSLAGVRQHIAELNEAMLLNSSYSLVLVSKGVIVARANLKDITKETAYVGYRVSKSHLSQGFASRCLVELVVKAQQLAIKTLKAQVLDNNPASSKVLEKQGFSKQETITEFYQLNDQMHDCVVFSKQL